MTADTRRQPVVAILTSARRTGRICAAIIGTAAVYATWQLAFRPAVDRWQLITELAIVCGLAWMNVLAGRVIRALATVILLDAIDAATVTQAMREAFGHPETGQPDSSGT